MSDTKSKGKATPTSNRETSTDEAGDKPFAVVVNRTKAPMHVVGGAFLVPGVETPVDEATMKRIEKYVALRGNGGKIELV